MKNKYVVVFSIGVFLGVYASFSGEAFSSARTATMKDLEGPSKPGYFKRITRFFCGKCLMETGDTVDKFGDDYGIADDIVFNPIGGMLVTKGEKMVEEALTKEDNANVSVKEAEVVDAVEPEAVEPEVEKSGVVDQILEEATEENIEEEERTGGLVIDVPASPSYSVE
ncbi:MAG: hypothetical protein LBP39_03400 [Rickettsiales bacterium]|jgi:hypothetical protein|nr:hypothetical protein [Rickettsiales bacterium]